MSRKAKMVGAVAAAIGAGVVTAKRLNEFVESTGTIAANVKAQTKGYRLITIEDSNTRGRKPKAKMITISVTNIEAKGLKPGQLVTYLRDTNPLHKIDGAPAGQIEKLKAS